MDFKNTIESILEGFPTRVENWRNNKKPDGTPYDKHEQVPFDQEASSAVAQNNTPVEPFQDEQKQGDKKLERLRQMNINYDMTDLSKIARKELHQYLMGKSGKEQAQTAVDELGNTVDAFDKVIGDQEYDRVPSWLAKEIFSGETGEVEKSPANNSDMHISADDDVTINPAAQRQNHDDSNATQTSDSEKNDNPQDTISKLQAMGKQKDPTREQARLKALRHAVDKRKRLMDNEYDQEAFWKHDNHPSPDEIEAKLKDQYDDEGPEYHKKLKELDQAFDRGEVDEWGDEIPMDKRKAPKQKPFSRIRDRVKKFLKREGRMPNAAELLQEMRPSLSNMVYEALDEA